MRSSVNSATVPSIDGAIRLKHQNSQAKRPNATDTRSSQIQKKCLNQNGHQRSRRASRAQLETRCTASRSVTSSTCALHGNHKCVSNGMKRMLPGFPARDLPHNPKTTGTGKPDRKVETGGNASLEPRKILTFKYIYIYIYMNKKISGGTNEVFKHLQPQYTSWLFERHVSSVISKTCSMSLL